MAEQLPMFWPSLAQPGQGVVDATAQVELPPWMTGTESQDQQRHARLGRHPTGLALGPVTRACADCRFCDTQKVAWTKWLAEIREWLDYECPVHRCVRSVGAPKIQGGWRGCERFEEAIDEAGEHIDDEPELVAYRPSNGTEGMIFQGRWCGRCQKRESPDGALCEILGQTMVLGVEDPDYPAEWVVGEDWPRKTEHGPQCLAFVAPDGGSHG